MKDVKKVEGVKGASAKATGACAIGYDDFAQVKDVELAEGGVHSA